MRPPRREERRPLVGVYSDDIMMCCVGDRSAESRSPKARYRRLGLGRGRFFRRNVIPSVRGKPECDHAEDELREQLRKMRGFFDMHCVKRLRLAYAHVLESLWQEAIRLRRTLKSLQLSDATTVYSSMRNPKILTLTGIFVLILGISIWNWISGWGLVTLNYKDAPLAKVIKSIEWQGGVKIRTNADPAMPVTIRVEKVSAYEAIDTLSVVMDGDARLAYVAAPDSKQIADVLAAFVGGTNPGGWFVSSGGGFGAGGGPVGESNTFVDPRTMDWKVSEVSDKSLQAILGQGAQKTGALFAVPQGWNPSISRLPASGKVNKVASALFSSAKGKVEEIFLVTVRPQMPASGNNGDRNADNGDGRRWEFTRTVFSPSREGGGQGRRSNGNPEWTGERIQSQINSLPPEERAEAQKQFDEMRAFWASVRDLPEDQRRQKIEEMMNNPEVQARMEERRDARDAQRTPTQRENRMRQYNERKTQMKEQASKS